MLQPVFQERGRAALKGYGNPEDERGRHRSLGENPNAWD